MLASLINIIITNNVLQKIYKYVVTTQYLKYTTIYAKQEQTNRIMYSLKYHRSVKKTDISRAPN